MIFLWQQFCQAMSIWQFPIQTSLFDLLGQQSLVIFKFVLMSDYQTKAISKYLKLNKCSVLLFFNFMLLLVSSRLRQCTFPKMTWRYCKSQELVVKCWESLWWVGNKWVNFIASSINKSLPNFLTVPDHQPEIWLVILNQYVKCLCAHFKVETQ